MSTFTIRAAMMAALALGVTSTSAFASTVSLMAGGHYEWHQSYQPGPRAPLAAPQRVWVADKVASADCDCDMMAKRMADCMMPMPGMTPAPSAN